MDELTTDNLWNLLVIFVSEFCGTGFLLYFGCMGLLHEVFPSHTIPDLQAALVWGAIISTVIMMFGHISRGHFNPAVTLCAVILRIITPMKSIAYFLAHISGATFGYWLLTVTLPRPILGSLTYANATDGFCNTVFHPKLAVWQGMLAEFMGTSVLIYSVCSAWDPRNSIWHDSIALKFGYVVIALVISLGPLTGASVNPARSFGPAFINGVWINHWAYWIASLGASLVTTLIYIYLYLPDAKQFLRTNEKLSDQFRQGSLYSKGEDLENLVSKNYSPSDVK